MLTPPTLRPHTRYMLTSTETLTCLQHLHTSAYVVCMCTSETLARERLYTLGVRRERDVDASVFTAIRVFTRIWHWMHAMDKADGSGDQLKHKQTRTSRLASSSCLSHLLTPSPHSLSSLHTGRALASERSPNPTSHVSFNTHSRKAHVSFDKRHTQSRYSPTQSHVSF